MRERERERESERQTVRQADRQTDRQTGRQKQRERGRKEASGSDGAGRRFDCGACSLFDDAVLGGVRVCVVCGAVGCVVVLGCGVWCGGVWCVVVVGCGVWCGGVRKPSARSAGFGWEDHELGFVVAHAHIHMYVCIIHCRAGIMALLTACGPTQRWRAC